MACAGPASLFGRVPPPLPRRTGRALRVLAPVPRTRSRLRAGRELNHLDDVLFHLRSDGASETLRPELQEAADLALSADGAGSSHNSWRADPGQAPAHTTVHSLVQYRADTDHSVAHRAPQTGRDTPCRLRPDAGRRDPVGSGRRPDHLGREAPRVRRPITDPVRRQLVDDLARRTSGSAPWKFANSSPSSPKTCFSVGPRSGCTSGGPMSANRSPGWSPRNAFRNRTFHGKAVLTIQ